MAVNKKAEELPPLPPARELIDVPVVVPMPPAPTVIE
jgi:hypothetical protein